MRAQLEMLYTKWCKETGRDGAMIGGSAINDFFMYVEDHYDEGTMYFKFNGHQLSLKKSHLDNYRKWVRENGG